MDHAEIAKRLLHGRNAAGAPAVSPDGSRIAHVVTTIDVEQNTTIARVWLDGAPITAGPHDGEPTWSPDGRFVAFVARRGEQKSERTLHVLPVDGPGEVRTVCTMPDGLADVAWSPDGRWLGFTSRVRDARYEAEDVSWQSPRKVERFFSRLNGEDWIFDRPNHVHVVAADGTGRPRDLTPGEFQHHGVAWLPDSSAIVTSAQRHDTWDLDLARDLYVVPLDGEIRALTHQTGDYGAPSVSPDGSTVAFIGTDDPMVEPQNAAVGVIAVAGGSHRWVSTDLDRTFSPTVGVRSPVWLDDHTLLATAEDRGDTHLYRLHVTADGGEVERVTEGRVSVVGFDASGDTIAMAIATAEHPAEIHTPTQRITHVTTSFPAWEKFTVPCADGSDEIDAWILRPTDFDPTERYPVLLNVHGGPFTQYGEYFFDEARMQAAAGFVAVLSNPRGSSGRHTGWGQAIMGPEHPKVPGTGWGSVDVDDVVSVLDAALERYDFCDPERVGMLGGSYGGYMANTLAAKHGHRFRGICSERAASNMLTFEWTSDIATAFRAEHGPNHLEDPDVYRRISPSEWAADITIPMLIIHSEEDWRCPISQAEELWVTLKLLGREVDFYRFPGENHELSRSGSPVHRKMRGEIILDWFADHLDRDGDGAGATT